MRYEIYFPQTFQRCIKFLKKKFPHVKDDLSPLLQNLQEDPQIGDSIPGWNRKIWKIRASSRDLKRGKSGSFRGLSMPGLPENEQLTPSSFTSREKDKTLQKLRLRDCLEVAFGTGAT